MADKTPVIIIRKKKKGEGHHGGAWKVAYADFVTAMMALFIVLWIMGQDADVKEAVASYFQDPIGFSNRAKNMFDGKSSSMINPGLEEEAKRKALEKERLTQMGEEIIYELEEDKNFKELTDQIKIDIVEEGLRIELIDFGKDMFFEIGTADLKPKAGLLIEKLGSILARINNTIIVEGHTDSRPYMGDGTGYTNFELSSDRANSARRALIIGGLPDSQFGEIRGHADRLLRDATDPFSEVNRRISIIVRYTSN